MTKQTDYSKAGRKLPCHASSSPKHGNLPARRHFHPNSRPMPLPLAKFAGLPGPRRSAGVAKHQMPWTLANRKMVAINVGHLPSLLPSIPAHLSKWPMHVVKMEHRSNTRILQTIGDCVCTCAAVRYDEKEGVQEAATADTAHGRPRRVAMQKEPSS